MNNDRFKFRVWDKENNKMYFDEEFALLPNGSLWPLECGRNLLFYDNPEKFILMQCTGAKDKNKKLIYDGDVIKETIEIEGEKRDNWIIFYEEKHAGFFKKRVSDEKCIVHIKHMPLKCQEIIGNIYENPDLLEK